MTHSAQGALAAAAARAGCGQDDLHRFSQHLQAMPLIQAARINPFRFADEARINSENGD